MRTFLVSNLLKIDYLSVILFGVNLIAGTFSFRDVLIFDRLLRGIAGLVICCLSVGFLIGGQRNIAISIAFGHYVMIMTSSQIDSDLAYVYLNFTGQRLFASSYHSPYENAVYTNVTKPCPRAISQKFLDESVLVLHLNDFCQYVIEVGSENYTNYVLIALFVVLPLAGISMFSHYIVSNYIKPTLPIQVLSEEFRSPTRNESSQMMSSFISTELSSYI